MDNEEDDSKKSSLSSSIMDDITAAATGYADYKKSKAAADPNNAKKDAKKDSAKSSLSSAENSALKPTGANNNSPLASARSAEKSSAGLYTGSGKAPNITSKSKLSGTKKGPLIIIAILIVGVIALIFALQPVMKLGTIIHNLSTSLGFDNSVALLEEKCEYVTQEMAMNGEINEDFYARLSENNIEVGQVTVAGEFVKTNTYLAYLDEDIASTDDNYRSDKTGSLSFRFNNKIIEAENFVAAVESDPVLYAAFEKALNVSSEYYFSDEVEGIYKQLGITRNEFLEYEETDDEEENYKQFSELVTKFLDKGNSTTIQVFHDDCRGESEQIATGSLGGSGLVSTVNNATSDYDLFPALDESGNQIYDEETGDPIYECLKVEGTERQDEAAALLSTALSSLEPYEATKAFMVITEPIQQVQAGDNGPINQLMNMLDISSTVSVKDIKTGGTIETTESIMTNSNFLAAITFEDYDAEEAYNFSRDRTLIATNAGNLETLKKINSATPTQQSASRNNYYGTTSNNLYGASSIYDNSVYAKKSETFTSTIGANQIVEGGAFLNNAINSTIGAFASDSATVAEYQKETNEILARQAAAERATLAWYDISSKNTFLGSIVHNFATAMTYFSAKTGSGFSIAAVPESVASVAKNSLASVTGLVSADNYEDGYLGTNGTDCITLNGTNYNLVGDIYCTEHKTIDTQYIDYTLNDFAGELGGQIDHSTGEIRKERGWLLETLVLGADRSTSVGASNSEICRRKENDFSNFFKRIYNKVQGMLGVSDCEKAGEDIATGAKYTFSSNNKEEDLKHAHLASAYALYQMANKIVGNANEVSIAKEKYYAENPLDNSEAGYIARISGMTKDQAEIALAYADYLTYLANYNPSTRYSFINPTGLESSPLDSLEFNEELANTYALVSKEIAYSDIRNRLVALS